ncbi:MAG: ABC transporter substrate-binding protein [Bacteroidales bacterium]|nr:ABC transporter substrate-binding protein [Bacteroidales bacterium]MBR1850671.1 ABC transporter substrate-binding protein [Bacteroidales bacterium]
MSNQTQMMHGKKYYVHLVEKGQTVYSISRAYKVKSYDAVTHVDIHFLHPGDTVWLPCRGQFSEAAIELQPQQKTANEPQTTPPSVLPKVKPIGKNIRVSLLMPLHLRQLDNISTSKFDVEQRGKKSYRQFEFIEFYEGLAMAIEELQSQGIGVVLNVTDVDMGEGSTVEQAFALHNATDADFVVALLLRDDFTRAAAIAQQSQVYIVNPMSTRSEICTDNPFVVKTQPSVKAQLEAIVADIKATLPDRHVFVVHSGSKNEKANLETVRQLLDADGTLKYTILNWNQSAKLPSLLKVNPGAAFISIYDQKKDDNRVMAGNLLNRLSAEKNNPPTLYTLTDWTADFNDIDLSQLQHLNYHTFYTSWDMTNERHTLFLQHFRERYNSEPTSPLASVAYDLMTYICKGLHKQGVEFWNKPTISDADLMQPLELRRTKAGLENEKARLFKMSKWRMVPVGGK